MRHDVSFVPKKLMFKGFASGNVGVDLTYRVLWASIAGLRAQSCQRFIALKEKAQSRALS
jgi:hypothetical protein